jgi:hypothetical protein
MEIDDFIEYKHRHHGNYREHGNDDDHDYSRYSNEQHHPERGNFGHFKLINILDNIRSNKKLRLLVVIAGIVILLIAIVLIVALLPLIIRLFNYISQNGLQSIFDGITGFLDKLWKGSGK